LQVDRKFHKVADRPNVASKTDPINTQEHVNTWHFLVSPCMQWGWQKKTYNFIVSNYLLSLQALKMMKFCKIRAIDK